MQPILDAMQPTMAEGAKLIAFAPVQGAAATLLYKTTINVDTALLSKTGFEDVTTLQNGSAKILVGTNSSAIKIAPSAQDAQSILIVAENPAGLCATLSTELESLGHRVSTTGFPSGIGEAAVDALQDQLNITEATQVVLLGDSQPNADLHDVQIKRTLTAAALTGAIEMVRQDRECALTVVTRGAFRLIDLHGDDATTLVAEISRKDEETEVQLRDGHRFVNRERITTPADEARHAGLKADTYALDFSPKGGLDSLHLRELTRKDPVGDEVEIAVKAAGLNFRDVLWCMGMLPEEAVEHGFSGPTIGMECAGEVVSVGPDVTHVKPGDRVMAFASSCFGTHVTTAAKSVAKMPDNMAYSEAATVPTVFLTAWYGLDYLARIEEGETILIHGAAGGVGLAAIQIAKQKGATIIGTAGSPMKRRMLELLGVDHVLNSRTLEYADQVMEITDGKGVDVILNSLAGEAILKNLNILRPFGRFLEIGKRDLYENSRIGLRPFRNNLSYFGIDADTLLIERPALAQRMFNQVIDQFASGDLKPLPHQVMPISRASEAFRAMQQSRHVGKLVVSLELDRAEDISVVRATNPVRAGGTYLITGGLGGFGLATAKWLVEQGADTLALVSRSGAKSDEAK